VQIKTATDNMDGSRLNYREIMYLCCYKRKITWKNWSESLL